MDMVLTASRGQCNEVSFQCLLILSSGNALLKEFPEIRIMLWKGQLWNGAYFCETIGSTSEENIFKYIERQKNVQL